MLNVNGVCYRPLLKILGLLEAYEARFGVARIAAVGVAATDNVDAARWIWEHTSPLEDTIGNCTILKARSCWRPFSSASA